MALIQKKGLLGIGRVEREREREEDRKRGIVGESEREREPAVGLNTLLDNQIRLPSVPWKTCSGLIR